MKFNDILLVRKKYANYIFELCFKNFKTPKNFLEEELHFKKSMDYDWMLQTQATRILHQNTLINQRIREFSKLAQVDKKTMNELMKLKIHFKGQKKIIEELQAQHYKEIFAEYTNIINNLCEKLLTTIETDALLNKMQLIIKKTEKAFIQYCLDWKQDKKKYHEDIANQTTFIVKTCEHLLQEISSVIEMESQNQHYSSNKMISNMATMKASTVTANCTNLSHYVENFKKFYPETLNHNDNALIKLDLMYDLKDIFNISTVNINKAPIDTKDKLEKIIDPIKKTQQIFHSLYEVNREYLIKLDIECKKMHKVSLSEREFTKTTLKQWLEHDADGIFYLFSQYLQDHKYAEATN